MNQQSVKKNFILQIAYQSIILVLPLIISPILTRTLGSTALGIYSYVNSVAYYFVVFANLGIVRYGQRIIAANRNDETNLRINFWSLWFTHAAVSMLSIIAYIVFILIFVEEDSIIYWINLLYVASALFDLTWLFYGLENFKNVVIKNLIVRILTFVFIVSLIKSPSDLWVYTFLEVLALFLGNILLIPSAVKEVPFIRFDVQNCISHLKPLLVLAISVVAVSLYSVFDKILLGVMTTKDNVAFYEYSNRIVNIPKTFIGVIGTVIFPRACVFANKGNLNSQKKYANIAFLGVAIIGFASIFGLLAVGPTFATEYFGESFSECGKIIISLTPLIVVLGLGDVIRSVFLIPMKRDKVYVVCICLNAVVNLILSWLLIPILGIYGAVIGTTAAEVFGLCYQSVFCRKQIDFRILVKDLLIFGTGGVIMYICIISIDPLLNGGLKKILIEMIFGVVIYAGFSVVAVKLFLKEVWEYLIILFKKIIQKK